MEISKYINFYVCGMCVWGILEMHKFLVGMKSWLNTLDTPQENGDARVTHAWVQRTKNSTIKIIFELIYILLTTEACIITHNKGNIHFLKHVIR